MLSAKCQAAPLRFAARSAVVNSSCNGGQSVEVRKKDFYHDIYATVLCTNWKEGSHRVSEGIYVILV